MGDDIATRCAIGSALAWLFLSQAGKVPPRDRASKEWCWSSKDLRELPCGRGRTAHKTHTHVAIYVAGVHAQSGREADSRPLTRLCDTCEVRTDEMPAC